MRPTSIIWFERFLLSALAIDCANNLASWSALSERLATKGLPQSPIVILGLCVLAPAVGLLLWYGIARKASNAACWFLVILVALGAIGFGITLWNDLSGDHRIMMLVATAAEALKIVAASLLLTKPSAAWFTASSRRS